MKITLEYFILLLPMIWELIFDYRRIVIKRKEDNHVEDIPVRAAMIIFSAIVIHIWLGKHFIQPAIYSTTLYFLFDPILNILCGKPVFHKGTNPIDKLWRYTDPVVETFVRLWFISVGVGFYYYYNLIVS